MCVPSSEGRRREDNVQVSGEGGGGGGEGRIGNLSESYSLSASALDFQ